MAIKLRWKMDKKESGLSSVGAAPRGFYLHDGEKVYARLFPLGGGWRGPLKGWYWVAGWDSNVPYKNTSDSFCKTIEEGKKQAIAYVKNNLNDL